MGTQLKNILDFDDIPASGTSTQSHGINVQTLALIPDHVQFENGDFGLVACTTTTITVINNGAGTASCRVLVELWHTYDRAFGAAPTEYVGQFPNPPFVTASGGGGGGSFSGQVFTYTCTGAEGSDFTITLPVAQATDDYVPTVSCGSVYAQLAFDCPDTLLGDRTTTAFRVVTSASVMAGDEIDVVVIARTA